MIVIASKNGQMGNRLNLFAHFMGFAIENNLKVINPAFEDYANLFETTSQDIFCRFPVKNFAPKPKPLEKKLRSKFFRYTALTAELIDKINIEQKFLKTIEAKTKKDYLDLSKLENSSYIRQWNIVIVKGYFFRDYLSVAKHANAIRAYFKPLKKYQDSVSYLVNTIRNNCDILIGIHIRQGDYMQAFPEHFHDTSAYVRIMQKVEALFENKKVAFLVCSDSKQDKNQFSKFNFTFGSNQIVEDMYSLSQCDYIIGVRSSYSRWASFYGNVPLYVVREPDKDVFLEDFKINFLDDSWW